MFGVLLRTGQGRRQDWVWEAIPIEDDPTGYSAENGCEGLGRGPC